MRANNSSVLVAVRITNHDFLMPFPGLEMFAVGFILIEAGHRLRGLAKIVYRFKQRDNVNGAQPPLVLGNEETRDPHEIQHFENIRLARCHADDV